MTGQGGEPGQDSGHHQRLGSTGTQRPTVPWGLDALNGTVSEPAWRTKPSWSLVATDDKMIPPPAQQAMSKRAGSTVIEVKGSHAVYVSQAEAVAALIAKAALESTSAGARARVVNQ
jgi:pimeloyl-ACP methyl ester carboxylesterase